MGNSKIVFMKRAHGIFLAAILLLTVFNASHGQGFNRRVGFQQQRSNVDRARFQPRQREPVGARDQLLGNSNINTRLQQSSDHVNHQPIHNRQRLEEWTRMREQEPHIQGAESFRRGQVSSVTQNNHVQDNFMQSRRTNPLNVWPRNGVERNVVQRIDISFNTRDNSDLIEPTRSNNNIPVARQPFADGINVEPELSIVSSPRQHGSATNNVPDTQMHVDWENQNNERHRLIFVRPRGPIAQNPESTVTSVRTRENDRVSNNIQSSHPEQQSLLLYQNSRTNQIRRLSHFKPFIPHILRSIHSPVENRVSSGLFIPQTDLSVTDTVQVVQSVPQNSLSSTGAHSSSVVAAPIYQHSEVTQNRHEITKGINGLASSAQFHPFYSTGANSSNVVAAPIHQNFVEIRNQNEINKGINGLASSAQFQSASKAEVQTQPQPSDHASSSRSAEPNLKQAAVIPAIVTGRETKEIMQESPRVTERKSPEQSPIVAHQFAVNNTENVLHPLAKETVVPSSSAISKQRLVNKQVPELQSVHIPPPSTIYVSSKNAINHVSKEHMPNSNAEHTSSSRSAVHNLKQANVVPPLVSGQGTKEIMQESPRLTERKSPEQSPIVSHQFAVNKAESVLHSVAKKTAVPSSSAISQQGLVNMQVPELQSVHIPPPSAVYVSSNNSINHTSREHKPNFNAFVQTIPVTSAPAPSQTSFSPIVRMLVEKLRQSLGLASGTSSVQNTPIAPSVSMQNVPVSTNTHTVPASQVLPVVSPIVQTPYAVIPWYNNFFLHGGESPDSPDPTDITKTITDIATLLSSPDSPKPTDISKTVTEIAVFLSSTQTSGGEEEEQEEIEWEDRIRPVMTSTSGSTTRRKTKVPQPTMASRMTQPVTESSNNIKSIAEKIVALLKQRNLVASPTQSSSFVQPVLQESQRVPLTTMQSQFSSVVSNGEMLSQSRSGKHGPVVEHKPNKTPSEANNLINIQPPQHSFSPFVRKEVGGWNVHGNLPEHALVIEQPTDVRLINTKSNSTAAHSVNDYTIDGPTSVKRGSAEQVIVKETPTAVNPINKDPQSIVAAASFNNIMNEGATHVKGGIPAKSTETEVFPGSDTYVGVGVSNVENRVIAHLKNSHPETNAIGKISNFNSDTVINGISIENNHAKYIPDVATNVVSLKNTDSKPNSVGDISNIRSGNSGLNILGSATNVVNGIPDVNTGAKYMQHAETNGMFVRLKNTDSTPYIEGKLTNIATKPRASTWSKDVKSAKILTGIAPKASTRSVEVGGTTYLTPVAPTVPADVGSAGHFQETPRAVNPIDTNPQSIVAAASFNNNMNEVATHVKDAAPEKSTETEVFTGSNPYTGGGATYVENGMFVRLKNTHPKTNAVGEISNIKSDTLIGGVPDVNNPIKYVPKVSTDVGSGMFVRLKNSDSTLNASGEISSIRSEDSGLNKLGSAPNIVNRVPVVNDGAKYMQHAATHGMFVRSKNTDITPNTEGEISNKATKTTGFGMVGSGSVSESRVSLVKSPADNVRRDATGDVNHMIDRTRTSTGPEDVRVAKFLTGIASIVPTGSVDVGDTTHLTGDSSVLSNGSAEVGGASYLTGIVLSLLAGLGNAGSATYLTDRALMQSAGLGDVGIANYLGSLNLEVAAYLTGGAPNGSGDLNVFNNHSTDGAPSIRDRLIELLKLMGSNSNPENGSKGSSVNVSPPEVVGGIPNVSNYTLTNQKGRANTIDSLDSSVQSSPTDASSVVLSDAIISSRSDNYQTNLNLAPLVSGKNMAKSTLSKNALPVRESGLLDNVNFSRSSKKKLGLENNQSPPDQPGDLNQYQKPTTLSPQELVASIRKLIDLKLSQEQITPATATDTNILEAKLTGAVSNFESSVPGNKLDLNGVILPDSSLPSNLESSKTKLQLAPYMSSNDLGGLSVRKIASPAQEAVLQQDVQVSKIVNMGKETNLVPYQHPQVSNEQNDLATLSPQELLASIRKLIDLRTAPEQITPVPTTTVATTTTITTTTTTTVKPTTTLKPTTMAPPTSSASAPKEVCNPMSPKFRCKGKDLFVTMESMSAWCLGMCIKEGCVQSVCHCGCDLPPQPSLTVNNLTPAQRQALLSLGGPPPWAITTQKPTTTDEPPEEDEWEAEDGTTTTKSPTTTWWYRHWGQQPTSPSPMRDFKLNPLDQQSSRSQSVDPHLSHLREIAWATELKARLNNLAANAGKPETTTKAAPNWRGTHWHLPTPQPPLTPQQPLQPPNFGAFPPWQQSGLRDSWGGGGGGANFPSANPWSQFQMPQMPPMMPPSAMGGGWGNGFGGHGGQGMRLRFNWGGGQSSSGEGGENAADD